MSDTHELERNLKQALADGDRNEIDDAYEKLAARVGASEATLRTIENVTQVIARKMAFPTEE